jgi:hypothetical protein
VERTRLGAGERNGAGEGERTGKVPGVGERTGPGERTGTGLGTVERTATGRTGAGGAADRTRVGANGAVVAGAATSGVLTERITASCFTMTGVPGGEALKKISAMPCGRRMQPCDAAYGGT